MTLKNSGPGLGLTLARPLPLLTRTGSNFSIENLLNSTLKSVSYTCVCFCCLMFLSDSWWFYLGSLVRGSVFILRIIRSFEDIVGTFLMFFLLV